MTSQQTEFDIYLASSSPRRRELLDQIGVRYQVLVPDLHEAIEENESAIQYVQRLALDKARAGLAMAARARPVLGSDTSVVIDGQILGKPRDRDHAIAMLQLLSGRSHQVMTAVAMVDGEHEQVRLSLSEVSFRPLGDEEIRCYWDSGEPKDKAGGYGIQGLGAIFIESIRGSYSGIMGLPIFETAELLQAFSIPVWHGLLNADREGWIAGHE